MEAFFAALSKRQSMLLLTAVTFSGQDALASFAGLPEDEQELLTHRAEQLLAIPRDRRIPLLVQEMKRLVLVRRGQLWSTEPERLASLLSRERPALVEVVLRALPAGLADSVREHLPNFPPVKLGREVRPEVLNLIRWKLEEQLAREGRKAGFKFSDVVLLRTRELVTVCDRLGARAISSAVNGLPDAERQEFLAKLTPDQRTLVRAAIEDEGDKKLEEPEARELLAVHEQGKGPSEVLRSAGAQRLARACIAQSPEYAQRVVERHPGDFGALLARWIRDERPKLLGKADAGRADIVADLERLAQKGVVDRPVRLPSKKSADAQKLATSAGSRLPPPRRREIDAEGSAAISGSRVDRDRERERDREDDAMSGDPVSGRGRDRMALRESRRNGLSDSGFRDPIAEREARKAGIPVGSGSAPPGASGPVIRAPKGPGERRGVESRQPSAWDDNEKTENTQNTDARRAMREETARNPARRPPAGSGSSNSSSNPGSSGSSGGSGRSSVQERSRREQPEQTSQSRALKTPVLQAPPRRKEAPQDPEPSNPSGSRGNRGKGRG